MAKMIIGGKKVDARGGATIDVINPADGTVVDTVPNAAAEDVDEAVAKAIAGQKVWGAVPLHERGRILRRFVEIALSKKEELASLLSRETGKPIREARAEIGNIPALFEGFVEKAKHLYGEAIPAGT